MFKFLELNLHFCPDSEGNQSCNTKDNRQLHREPLFWTFDSFRSAAKNHHDIKFEKSSDEMLATNKQRRTGLDWSAAFDPHQRWQAFSDSSPR